MKTPYVFAGAAASIATALFLIAPVIANAAATWHVSVGNTGACTTSDRNCATIQAAVNAAASGDNIQVAAGTYDAFKVNGKAHLTINGAGNSTVIAPTTLINTGVGHKYTSDMQVSVFVNNSSDITLKNFEIEGNGKTPGSGGPDALLFWNNSNGTVNTLNIVGNYPINGVQSGQGIAVDAANASSALTVSNTTISGTQKNGIDAEDGESQTSGHAGTITLDVENSTFTGAGPTSAIAQNGIVAWNEGGGTVTAKVKGSSFSNVDYTGANDTAAAILAYGSASITPVSNDTFTNTQQYIDAASSGTAIDATNGNTFDGVSPTTANGTQLATIENGMYSVMEDATVDPIFVLPKTYIVTTSNRGIQAGLNLATNGYTVLVTPGTYPGDVTPPASNNVTLEGVGGPILNVGSGYGINLDTGSTNAPTNFTFEGFTVNASSGTLYAFKAYKADGLTLNNDTFNGGAGNTGGGVDINTMRNVTFNNVTSTGFHKNGFAVTSAYTSADAATSSSKNITFNNITSSDNGWTGVSFYTVGDDHSPSSIGGSHSISGVQFTGTDTISDNGNGGATQGGIFVEGDSDANAGAGNTPANTVTTDGTTLDITHVAFSGNGPFDIINYQTAPVNAIGTTFDPGAITGDDMTPAQITVENGKIYDQLDKSSLGLVTYYTPYTTPPSTPVLSMPLNGSATTTNDFYFTWNPSTDAPRGGPITYQFQSSLDPTEVGGVLTNGLWISGTLTDPDIHSTGAPDGTWYWQVRAEDAWGNWSDWSPIWSVTIAQVVTDPATNIQVSDATLNGQIGDADATGHSFWVSTSPFATSSPSIPSGVYSTPDMGAISAGTTFSAQLTSLTGDGVPANMPAIQPNTTYYYVAWANVGGTWYPGQELSFTTGNGVASPFVTTNDATNPSATDATLNATLGGSDADQVSFWVSTSPINTSSSNIPSGVYSSQTQSNISAGGTFATDLATIATSSIPGGMPAITPNTKYYYVAWAHVNGIWYPGNQDSVTTSSNNPEVHIFKYIDGVQATAANTNSATFPMETTFTSSTLGNETDAAFTLSPKGWGAGDSAYEASYVGGADGDNYSAWEMTGANSNVGTSCDGHPFALEGYTTGDTLADAAAAAPSLTAPAFTNLEQDEYVIVWNETCPSATTDAANPVDITSATLNGTNGAETSDESSFWWGTTSAGPFTAAADASGEFPAGWNHDTGLPGEAANTAFSEPLTGLTASTTYYFAAWSHVNGVWYPGAVETFTTGAEAAPVISNETLSTTPTTATVTWDTDHNATSRVVYGLTPQADGATNTCTSPDSTSYDCYGYDNSTNETDTPADTNGVIHHSVTITGLTTGDTYYFRPVSEGSPEAEGDQLSGTPSTLPDIVITPGPQSFSGSVGTAFSQTFTASDGVDTSFTMSEDGALPDGLATSTTGTTVTISGTPTTVSGPFSFDINAASSTDPSNFTSDGYSISITATPPAAPTAVADSATTNMNTEVTIDVLANDTNATGVTDIGVATAPQNGTATLDADGTSIDYTPDANFSGTDTFSYDATGPGGTSATPATVTVTVKDTTTPVLTLMGANPLYVLVNDSYNEPGVTITDPSDPNIDYFISVDGGTPIEEPPTFVPADLDTSVAGNHTLTYTATNNGGNTGSTTRTVIVLNPLTIALTSTSATDTTISDNPIPVTATFSGPVQDFTSGDIMVTNGSADNVQLSGDSQSATFDVLPSSNGAVTVTVPAGDVQSMAGDTNASPTEIDFTYAASTSTPPVTPTFTSSGGGGGGNGPISGSLGGGPIVNLTTTPVPGQPTGPQGQVLGASTYNFATNFCTGSTGEDVIQLQTILIADGYLKISAPTGYYGALTKAAVVEYQKANGITPTTGCVGPKTRAALNAGVTPTQTQENQSLEQSLEAQLQSLLLQIDAMSGTTSTTTTK